uniref:F-box domain-containing protein n=1 Tax=Steinernema glaseri TaxID=37863 RepID=A0A1I7Y484_9BILA
MDTVPRLFIESVCLRLLDHRSLLASTGIPSAWGEICIATRRKIHTLRVYLDVASKTIYAAAQPVLLHDYYSNAVPLDRVDLKFITNFQIKRYIPQAEGPLLSIWKEITLDDLKRLVHFIRPVRNERRPLVYDYKSLNTLRLDNRSQWVNKKLLSMRLPVDMVDLGDVEADGFFEFAGTLYYVRYHGPDLEKSMVETLIEKFLPIDGGCFSLGQSLADEQMKRLFEKAYCRIRSLPFG